MDLVVTVKNAYVNVYRHVYIKAYQSYTIYVQDGTYQVFFYHGQGWNPQKVVAQTNCGNLKGGFVQNESFSCGEKERLTNQVLTYSFTDSGYWSPKNTTAKEAF